MNYIGYNSDEDPQIITVTGAAYLPNGLHLRVDEEIDGYKWIYYANYMNAMPMIFLSVVDNLDSAIPYKKVERVICQVFPTQFACSCWMNARNFAM